MSLLELKNFILQYACIGPYGRQNMAQELWRTSKVGDKIRLVEMSPEFLRPGYGIHPETLRAYRKLLARGRSLRVCKIDAWGLSYVHFRFRGKERPMGMALAGGEPWWIGASTGAEIAAGGRDESD
jgi:hypothetical protein